MGARDGHTCEDRDGMRDWGGARVHGRYELKAGIKHYILVEFCNERGPTDGDGEGELELDTFRFVVYGALHEKLPLH